LIEEDPIEKIPLSRSKLRWEDCVKKYVKKMEIEIRWREVAEDKDR